MEDQDRIAELIYKAALYEAIRTVVEDDRHTSPAIDAVRVAGATVREVIRQVLACPSYDRDDIWRGLLNLAPASEWGEDTDRPPREAA